MSLFVVKRGLLIAALGVVWVGMPVRARDDPPDAQTRPAETQEVRRLIERMGDPAYSVRADAVRRLIAVGPDALGLLRRAAEGDDWEIALRAREVIDTLRVVLLTGATVELSVEPQRVRWDEPFTLRVLITNHCGEPCRTPFAPEPAGRELANRYARQVGAMMDLADFLIVTGPDGREAAFHTDPIDEDPAVEEAVRLRVEQSPTGILAPGRSQRFELREFNRGWSHYRMLEAGDYTIRFEYEPAWTDPELAREHVGRVTSNTVRATVTQPAPELVRSGDASLVGEVVCKDDVFTAYLRNASDRRTFVNTNWGTDVGRRARLVWRFRSDDGDLVEVKHVPAREPFSIERIVSCEPLERVEIARIDRATVLAALGEGRRLSETKTHGFEYSNMLRRGSLLHGRGAGDRPDRATLELYESLPLFIFAGTVSCGPR